MKGSRIEATRALIFAIGLKPGQLWRSEYTGVSAIQRLSQRTVARTLALGWAGSFFGANFCRATKMRVIRICLLLVHEVNIAVRTGSTTQRKVRGNRRRRMMLPAAERGMRRPVIRKPYSESTAGRDTEFCGEMYPTANSPLPQSGVGHNLLRRTSGSVTAALDFNSGHDFLESASAPSWQQSSAHGQCGTLGTAGSAVGAASVGKIRQRNRLYHLCSPSLGAPGSSAAPSLPAKTGVVSLRQDAYKNPGPRKRQPRATFTIEARYLARHHPAPKYPGGQTSVSHQLLGIDSGRTPTPKTVRLHLGGY